MDSPQVLFLPPPLPSAYRIRVVRRGEIYTATWEQWWGRGETAHEALDALNGAMWASYLTLHSLYERGPNAVAAAKEAVLDV